MKSIPVICAVDVGTSEIRAALISETGQKLQEVSSARDSNEQFSTIDAEVLWTHVVDVLHRLTEGNSNLLIRNVSVTSHIGQVVLGKNEEIIIESGSWSDSRGADLLQNQVGENLNILHVTGKPGFTGGWIPLLIWLRERHPELHEKVRWVMSPKDFINFRLTGNITTDPTSAAYSFGYDVRKRCWDEDLIALTGLDSNYFPKVVNSMEIIGEVSRNSSTVTGLPIGIPVVSGAPDGTLGAAALIGLAENVIADIAGTTDVLMRVTHDIGSLDAKGIVLNPFILPKHWSYGGATGLTGGATSYWSRLFGFENVNKAMEAFGGAIEMLPAGCDGLLLSPLLSGSRFPTWNAKERGAVWGLEAKHETPHFLKASYESASFVVREAIEHFPTINGDKSMIYLAGGIVRSRTIVQMRADILGCSITSSTQSNLSLQGAALLGLTAARSYDTFEEARLALKAKDEVFTPNEANSQLYEDLFQKWLLHRNT